MPMAIPAPNLAARLRRLPSLLSPARPDQPLRLVRWFGVLGLLCVTLVAYGAALGIERLLRDNMLRHEAELSADFINSLVQAERTWSYFSDPGSAAARVPLESFFGHVANLPGVVRANVFSPDGTVLWSSNEELRGRRFPDNDELARAVAGRIVVTYGTAVETSKPEHVALDETTGPQRFMEAYLPIRSADRRQVIGVVEIYRLPQSLFRELDANIRQAWIWAGASAAMLYGLILLIALRADRTLRHQQALLVENETLATLGSVASAVAHGVRNPLASIRSSAELAAGESGPGMQECLDDIQREVDRMDGWVRDLLLQARGDQAAPGAVEVSALLRESLRSFAAAAGRQGVAVRLDAPEEALLARANPGPLAQAVENLIANALEAMPEGGALTLSTARGPLGIEIRVQDTGPGIPERIRQGRGGALASTKPKGTGLGLALARRIVASYGGRLALLPAPGRGTLAVLHLLPAER